MLVQKRLNVFRFTYLLSNIYKQAMYMYIDEATSI